MTEINIEYISQDKFNLSWPELEVGNWYLKKPSHTVYTQEKLFLKGEDRVVFESVNNCYEPMLGEVTNTSWLDPTKKQYKLVNVTEINFKVEK